MAAGARIRDNLLLLAFFSRERRRKKKRERERGMKRASEFFTLEYGMRILILKILRA